MDLTAVALRQILTITVEKDSDMKKLTNNNFWALPVSIVLFLLCLATFMQAVLSSRIKVTATPTLNRFEGSYSYNGTDWQPITSETKLSAKNRSVTLRGHFTHSIPDGFRLYYYRNHIGVAIKRNGQTVLADTITAQAQLSKRAHDSVCGREWLFYRSSGISPKDDIEITLTNLHRFCNEGAYQEFLETTYVGNGSTNVLENMLQSKSFLPEAVGILLCITAVMLFGISVASKLLHIRRDLHLFVYSFATLFSGLFMIVDVLDISLWSEQIARNTYARQLCMMLAAYFAELSLCEILSGSRKRAAYTAMFLSAVLDSALMVVAMSGVMVIFDTQPYWSISQVLLCLLLILCGIHELACNARQKHYAAILVVLLPFAVLLDIAKVWDSIYSTANCTRIAVGLTFLYYAVRAIYYVLINHNAVSRAAALENELAESRISVMLSQLQPHFLYNVLNSIYYLCKHDPMTAREMVDKFSDYLRNNMSSLERKGLIPFSEEYNHIQTYLSLEQLRFQKTLDVVYDIDTMRFRLPPLTVQPLVENAVRHGITKKHGGGMVRISTSETADSYIVVVRDTGRGFDPEHYMDDGKVHIGIRNVRERLERMVGGTLTIESVPDVGTVATITIPRKEGMLI